MDVHADWCGPCKMLYKNTFQNKYVANYINKNYYAVKFNAEGDQEVNYKGKKIVNSSYVPSRKGRNRTHDLTYALKVEEKLITYTNGYQQLAFYALIAGVIIILPFVRKLVQEVN